MSEIILTLSATDQPGIVAAVATFLADAQLKIFINPIVAAARLKWMWF